MDKTIIKFDNAEIEEYNFYQYKIPISINNINNIKLVVSNKFPFSKQNFRYFIGYKDDKKIRPLWIFFPKTEKYKSFDETKYTCFMIEEESVFDKYMTILGKVSNIFRKGFNSKLVYNKTFIKSKRTFNTCFYMQSILIGYRKNENYYPKGF